ncbi:Predicted arabinose efflux permease, MFS family [Lentzea xinjiangensis]|uniref:Predicted arabinose efflux permease, MFS family n=1 Tax=Lentzea xinjiangensis TaxID=402600 RepID=A0A1H9SZ96_9PSEU|nr:Predicted arabinose efflux permease, MFS family [Lentzea xinjiangensis]
MALAASCGEGMLLAVVPLLAASITSDPRAVSLATMASQLPWVLLPLLVGVVIDRVRRASLLGLALAVQALACAVMALAVHAGMLSLPVLMVIAFVLVVGQVITEGTRGAMVPSVVSPDALDAANSRLLLIDVGVVRFLIPPLAGFLVVWSQPAVGWIAALFTAFAVLLSFRLRAVDGATTKPTGRPRPLREIRDGLHYLVGNRLLRSITVAVSAASFAWFMGYATLALYVEQILHLDGRGYGLLLACTAVGFAGGAAMASRVIARLGYPVAMRVAVTVEIACKLLIGVVPAHWSLVAVVLVVHSAATFVWNVGSQSSRQRYTPPELLGRVLTSHRALSWGMAPLGAVAGGLVAGALSLEFVWVVAAAIQAAGVALVWRNLSAAGFENARLVAVPVNNPD